MVHSAAARKSGRSPVRMRAAAAAGLTAVPQSQPSRCQAARHGGPRGVHGALGAGPERSWLDGSLVLSEQRPDALRARDARAVPRPQQDARVPGP